MLKKSKKLLAFMLSIALVFTTFGSDLASAVAYAEEETQQSADGITTWDEIVEKTSVAEDESGGNQEDASGGLDAESEDAQGEDTPADTEEGAGGDVDVPENPEEDPAPEEPAPEAPSEEASIETPSESASTESSTDAASEASEEASTGASEDESEASSEASTGASNEDASESSSEASSEASSAEEEIAPEEKTVTVTYAVLDDQGGDVSRKSETIDLLDEEQSFKGSVATAWKDWKFVEWTDEDGNFITQDAELVPSDIEEDTGFIAVFEEEIKKPAVAFTGTAGNVSVYINAPEGAFPEGTEASISPVYDQEIIDAATEMVDGDTKKAVAVDITFTYKGKEIEPLVPINVKMYSDEIKTADETSVVHIDDNGEAEVVGDLDVNHNSVEFDSDNFSVYVIVFSGEDARLNIRFMNGTTEIASVLVKANDDMNALIFDPGTGTLDDGVIFKGWTRDKNYTAATEALSIEGVRTEVAGLAQQPHNDMDEVLYYAKLIKQHIVSYLDEDKILVQQDKVDYRADAQGTDLEVQYLVNGAYSPKDDTHDFRGWHVYDGLENIVAGIPAIEEGETEPVFKNNKDIITIKGDVIFSVDSPAGHWLIFNENGKGATYNAPQFVIAGHNTKRPCDDSKMKRKGYKFKGWFTDQACTAGNEFEFGHPITEKTVVYAKWEANATALYTILVWKQNATRDGYDFSESIVAEGTVGHSIKTEAMTEGQINQAKYVTILGKKLGGVQAAKDDRTNLYGGFTLREDNPIVDATIRAEGDAVANVYFDRMEYTLKLYVTRVNNGRVTTYTGASGYSNRQINWNVSLNGITSVFGSEPSASDSTGNYFTISSYYGGPISGWPAYTDIAPKGSTFISWLLMPGASAFTGYGSGGDTYKGTLSIMDEQVLGDLSTTEGNWLIARYASSSYSWTYNIYFADENGNYKNTPDKVVEARSQQNTAASQHHPDYEGYDYVRSSEVSHSGNNYSINYYYTPKRYKINYMDGNYVDGNGGMIQNRAGNQLTSRDNIAYGSSLKDYDIEPELPEGEEGYLFAGWYMDKACSSKYEFDKHTMPLGGVTVYAKWQQIQYRVFLHPNAGTDPTLYWGDTPENPQEMNFRVSYGDEISAPDGTRTGYILKGWYTSTGELFTDEGFKLNESTVTEAYDKEHHFTNGMDKWGNNATSNGDLDRWWITKEFNLTAQWRRVLDGAEGIAVQYSLKDPDVSESKNETFVDPDLYADNTQAIAAAAVEAPEGYHFESWVMQKWNAETGAFEDEGTVILPGTEFAVMAENAHVVEVSAEDKTYTVQLRADYKKIGEPRPTYIPWFKNDGSPAYHIDTINDGESHNDSSLIVNHAVPIQAPPARLGYEFLGWARISMGSTAEAADQFMASGNWDQNLTEDDLYLVYNADGSFTCNGEAAEYVAADEDDPYHAMFAVWKESTGTYIVEYYKGTVTDNTDNAHYLGASDPVTVTIDGTSNKITLNEAQLNLMKPEKGYSDGVQQDPVPFTVQVGAGNVIKVLYSPLPIKVHIIGNTATKPYTGQEQQVSGYTFTVEGEGYGKDDFSFVGATGVETITDENGVLQPVAKGTNVGPYPMNLTRECFKNINDDFTDVTFVIDQDGKLTITPVSITVTIKGHKESKSYNGEEQKVTGYDVEISDTSLYSEADFTFNGTAEAKGTNVNTYPMGLTKEMFTNTNPNFDGNDEQGNPLVTFVVIDGELKITPIGGTITIVGEHDIDEYNGQEHKVTGYTVTIPEALRGIYTEDDFTFTAPTTMDVENGKPVARRTDVGKTDMGLKEDQFKNTNPNFVDENGNSLIEFDVTDGYQQITPIEAEIVVTITGAKGHENYDGTEKTVSGYTFQASNDLYKESDMFFDKDGDGTKDTLADAAVAKGILVDTYPMGLTSSQFKNNNPNFTNVTFIVNDGELVIDPIQITVTITGPTATDAYDGQEHKVTGYTAVVEEQYRSLYDVTKDFNYDGTKAGLDGKVPTVESGEPVAKGTDVGTYDMHLGPAQFINTNNNFVVTFDVTDGWQKITAINVTVNITGANDTTDYDGQPHTVTGYTAVADSDLYDVTKDFTFNGTASATRTDVGTEYMYLKGSDAGDQCQFTNINPNFEIVTFVIVKDGYQEIEPIDVTVNITGNNDTKVYDGQPHTVTGYTAVASSSLYDVTKDFTFSGDATATRTDVGTEYMYLKGTADGTECQFTNTNPNFGTVTFVIVKDGYQEITPITDKVTVYIVGANNSSPYDGQEHSVSGYQATADNALYDVTKDFTFSGDATAAQTTVGIDYMELKGTDAGEDCQFKNTNPNFTNVEFVVTDGYQEITPIEVVVTIVGNNDTFQYDKQEHVVSDYVITNISTDLYTVDDFDFIWSGDTEEGKPAVRRTEVGKTMMGLSEANFVNNNPNFIKTDENGNTKSLVKFEVTDGYIEITEPDAVVVKIKGTQVTEVFDNTEKVSAGYEILSISNSLFTEEDIVHTWTGVTEEGKPAVKATNVGTYPMGLEESQFSTNNENFIRKNEDGSITPLVTFEIVEDGWLKITPISVEVTIVGNNVTHDYDGTEYTASGYEITNISNPLFTKADVQFHSDTYTSSVSRTNAGTSYMGLEAASFYTVNPNFIDPDTGDLLVTFIVTDGYVKINPISLTVTIEGNKDSKPYNGEEQKVTGYTVTIPDAFKDLYKESDFTFTGTDEAKGTDVNTYPMGLAEDQFVNTNANFIKTNEDGSTTSLVTFEVTDGELVITPIDVVVTIVGDNVTHDYDGQAYTAKGYTATTDNSLYDVTKDFTFNGNDEATRTDVGTTKMGLKGSEAGEDCQFKNTNPNFKTVTFNVTDGFVTINPVGFTVIIKGNKGSEPYTGSEQKVTGYTVTIPDAFKSLYTESDFTFTGTDEAKGTDVGIYPMGLAEDQFVNTNANFIKTNEDGTTENLVKFDVTDGELEITPINVTVNIVGDHNGGVYNNTEYKATGYTATTTSDLYDVTKDFTFDGTVAGEDGEIPELENGTPVARRTEVGTTKMHLGADQFKNTNKNFATVTFNVTDGYVTVTPVEEVQVTITGHNLTKDYDGTEYSVQDYDVDISDPLYTVDDFDFNPGSAVQTVTVDGKVIPTAARTDVGKTPMNLDESMFVNNSKNFAKVTFTVIDGFVEINPVAIKVKITGAYDETDYDGSEHIVKGYTYEVLTEGFKNLYTDSDFDFTPGADVIIEDGQPVAKGTDVDTYKMHLAPEQFANNNPNFIDKDGNSLVTFDVEDGKLVINPIDVIVNIEGESDEVTYDGNEHKVKGYTATTESTLYDVTKDFTFTAPEDMLLEGNDPIAKGIEADTYKMGLAAEQFANKNPNFKTVTFNVKDGVLTINPITDAVIVKITGATGTKVYNGAEQSVAGYTATTEHLLYNVATDFEFTPGANVAMVDGQPVAKGTDVATYKMNLAKEMFKNTNQNFSNVTFEVEDGKLEITPLAVTVEIEGNTSEVDYDGKEHEVSGYKVISISDPLYKEDYFGFNGNDFARRTDVGIEYIGFSNDGFYNNNNNFTVTFDVTDGYIRIKPVAVTVWIEGNNSTDDYNGQEHVVNGYRVTKISSPAYTESDFDFVPAAGRDLESGLPAARRTEYGFTPMNLSANEFKNKNVNFKADGLETGEDLVTFIVTDGFQAIGKISATVVVQGNIVEEVYDGKLHVADGYTATCENKLLDLSKDIVFKGKAHAETTDIGTVNMTMTADDFECTNPNFSNVVFLVTPGYVKVTPAKLLVKIVGNHDEFIYDTKSHTVTGYTIKFEDVKTEGEGGIELPFTTTAKDLYKEEYINFTGKAEVTGKAPDHYPMGLAKSQFSNTNTNFEVEFEVTDGYLDIIKRGQGEEYIITATTVDTTKPYIGDYYRGFDYNIEATKPSTNPVSRIIDAITGLLEGITANADDGTPSAKTVEIDGSNFTVTGLSVPREARDVGKYPLDITGNMVVTDEDGNDVTDQFTLKTNIGTLEITPATLTIMTGSATRQYNGLPLTNPQASISGFVGTDVADYANLVKVTATGSRTEVGSSTNTYSISWGNAEVIKGNYTISENLGTLTVTPGPDTPEPPTPTPTPAPTPEPTPTPTPAPPAPTPGGQAVLGERRETGNGQAVLGARRGRTDDNTNTAARGFAILVSAAAAISLLFAGRKKEEEDQK